MEQSVCRDNAKFTVRLLGSPCKVLSWSRGFYPRSPPWGQVHGAAVQVFFSQSGAVPVPHPAAQGAVTCLTKPRVPLSSRTRWKSVLSLNLTGSFFTTDKSLLICQPQLWNAPAAWTIFHTTLVFFVKAFFYWSELTGAAKPCEFDANCCRALTGSSRAMRKDVLA